MKTFKIKGITSSKDAPVKTPTVTRLSRYMKKGSKIKKRGPIMSYKKGSSSGCGSCGGTMGRHFIKQEGGVIKQPLTAATNPNNSHRLKDPYRDTNLSVGGGAIPTKLSLAGRALTGYTQGITRKGIPSISYTGSGINKYTNKHNRGVLGRYLDLKNPGVKVVMIDGKRVAIRQ